MSLEEVVNALSNDLRREIIRILGEKEEPLTVKEIYDNLAKENRPTYRQSVNRALDELKEANLVKKIYSDDKKNLVYSLKHEELKLKLLDDEVTFL